MIYHPTIRSIVTGLSRSILTRSSQGASPLPGLVAPVPALDGTAMAPAQEDATYSYYIIPVAGELSFDRDGAADFELIAGGGGAGSDAGNAAGGGGAGGYLLSLGVGVTAGTSYSVAVGQGGSGGTSVPVATAGNGTATSITGLSLAVAGGGHGASGSSSDKYGGSGACSGGSADNGNSTTSWNAVTASLGGKGAIGTGAGVAAGAGGGMGGDATPAPNATTPSVPGPGIVSILGDTVCAGGVCRLYSSKGNGVDAVAAGGGGGGACEAYTAQGYVGGAGADGRVVIRVPKAFAAFNLTVAEPAVDGMGLALNAAMTSATVAVAGTDTSGTAGTMQARVLDSTGAVVTDWADAGTSNGATFSVSVTAPASTKKHHVEVRRADAPAVVARQTKGWRTAIIVIGHGQSNKLGENNSEAPQTVSALATIVRANPLVAGTLMSASDFTSGAFVNRLDAMTGDGQVAFVNELITRTGLPVTYVVGGKSGTNIDNLSPGTNPYECIATAVSALKLSCIHGFSWNQGEAEVDRLGVNITEAGYVTALNSIRNGFAALTGQAGTSIPIVQTGLGTTGSVARTDTEWTAVRLMQRDYLPANMANYHYVCGADDFVRADEFHGPGGSYSRRQLREARYLAHLLGFASSPGTFRVASLAKTSATVTTLTVQHGMGSAMEIATRTDGVVGGTVVATVTSGALDSPAVPAKVNSFQVSGDGGATWVAVPYSGVALTNGTTITLTHADVGTGGVRKLRYFYGREPNGIIRDNSAYNWPLRFEDGMAAS